MDNFIISPYSKPHHVSCGLGRNSQKFWKKPILDTFLAVVTLGFYNYYLNYVAMLTILEDRDINPKSSSGDWVSSILFAIVAATLVHTYFIQPFTIPSSSLEKSLLVGDFLIRKQVSLWCKSTYDNCCSTYGS